MKKSNFRDVVLSALAGAVLALVVVLSSAGLTQKVSAEEEDYYCNPPVGCNTMGCFTRLDGVRSCKNYGNNGGTCESNACTRYGGMIIE